MEHTSDDIESLPTFLRLILYNSPKMCVFPVCAYFLMLAALLSLPVSRFDCFPNSAFVVVRSCCAYAFLPPH